MDCPPQNNSAAIGELTAMARQFEELAAKFAASIQLNWNSPDEVARLKTAHASARRGAALVAKLIHELR